jgi:trans-aconitate 2-methyltransferase
MESKRVVWDATQYERFAAERERPFHDLLARVPDGNVRVAADLGCGTGKLTRTLLARWPQATIYGVDNSTEMLSQAARDGTDPRLRFIEHDLGMWEPPRALDRIISNAALHWLPDHATLLSRLVAHLAPDGVIAVQMPNNRAEQPHRTLADLIGEPRWKARVPSQALAPGAAAAEWYVATLRALGLEVDLWETIYYHQLPSAEAVIEWLKGTTLRPILSALEPIEANELLQSLHARLATTYRCGPEGIVFPFRRLFFIARHAQ